MKKTRPQTDFYLSLLNCVYFYFSFLWGFSVFLTCPFLELFKKSIYKYKRKWKKSIDILWDVCIINIRWTNKTAELFTLMRIGVMAAQQTLTLLVEVRVLYP